MACRLRRFLAGSVVLRRARRAGGVQRRRLPWRARAVAQGGRGALHRLGRGARGPGRRPHQRDQRPRHVRRRFSVQGVVARGAGGAQLRRRPAAAGLDPQCATRRAAALADQRATEGAGAYEPARRPALAGRDAAAAAASRRSVRRSAAALRRAGVARSAARRRAAAGGLRFPPALRRAQPHRSRRPRRCARLEPPLPIRRSYASAAPPRRQRAPRARAARPVARAARRQPRPAPSR